MKKQKGYTLVELMLVLMVVVGGLGFLAKAGLDAQAGNRISEGIRSVSLLRSQASLYGAPSNFVGMTLLNIPVGKTIGDGSGTNPWHGDYSLTVNNAGADYTLTLTEVPADASGPMMKAMAEGASTVPAYTGTTLSVGYDE